MNSIATSRMVNGSGDTRPDGLSVRETEVLRLIALGHTSAEVARQLHLSPRTVETHRARINRKLGLTKRAELVRYALRRGLLGV
jgi:two-component system response regulator NreC